MYSNEVCPSKKSLRDSRARHVKCDETRPECRQCTSTGRECAYTSGSKSLTFVTFTPAPTLSSQPDSDPIERRALSYYQHQAAFELGGVCSPELWSKFILPVSHQNTAIKHAVIALVTLHEDYADSQQLFPAGSRYALQHYAKAVNELLNLETVARPEAVDIALVSCIVFSSLEFLRGHFHSALSHVLSGKRILEEERTNANNGRFHPIPRLLLEDIFLRLETQVISIGGNRSIIPVPIPLRPPKPIIPPIFASVPEAFFFLETLQNQIIHFFSFAAQVLVEKDHKPEAFEMLAPELTEFEQLFNAWQQAFQPLSESKFKPNSETSTPALLLLKILRAGFSTIFPLARNRHANECDFDRFTAEFEMIVDCAELYLRLTSTFVPHKATREGVSLDWNIRCIIDGKQTLPEVSENSPTPTGQRRIVPKPEAFIKPTFSMSTGILPCLCLCGFRCRDPRIRRKALRLLQTCNRREGLWDSTASARVAEMVIRLEEGRAMEELSKSGQLITITNASQISATARVMIMGVKFGAERSGEVAFQINEPSSDNEGDIKTNLVRELSF